MSRSQPASRSEAILAFCFLASGCTAVCYQVLLSRYVQLVVGATAYAVSAILLAFLLGMAVGSATGGPLADRMRRPLRLYALAELGIGAWCAAFPLIQPWLLDAYVAWAPPPGTAGSARHAVRFAAGMCAYLLPSVLMGMTTPAFARAYAAGRPDVDLRIVRLYRWNTLGAACGALGTAYFMVPVVGIRGSLAGFACLNALVAALAWREAREVEPVGSPGPASVPEAVPDAAHPRRLAAVLFAMAALTGFASFALEVVWTHLLAVLLGNSVYAFGLMLGALLLGLWAGTLLAARWAGPLASTAIGYAVAASGAVILFTLGVWDDLPRVFLLFARSNPGFVLLELVRFAVAFTLMVVPTALFGAAFPLVLGLVGRAGPGFGSRVGRVYAVNTLGAAAGALAGPYVLLAALGSVVSLRLLAVLLLAGGGLAIALLARGTWRTAGVTAALGLAAFGAAWNVRWDVQAMSTASAVYLGRSATHGAHLVYEREHPTGGLTTVVQNAGVKTLLTNGKFEGDDEGEIPIQHRLAHIPTLFTSGRERALVVGLGTGVTLAAVAAHGFEETVCAELSEPIVEAASTHFAHVNGNVLSKPDVTLAREDGRSVLLERPDRYDVVSVEITTIWFAGSGNLYSREFYELVSRRLRPRGVLLQWFPVHHLSARNLYVVVNTVRSVFPHVSVWTHRHQGFVVASNEPLQLDLASVRGDLARPELAPYLGGLGSGNPLELVSDLAVSDVDADPFLDAMAGLLHADRGLLATDSWPTLEYETPKDVLAHFSYFQNRGLLRRFRSAQGFPFRGQPTDDERRLVQAAFVRGWQDPRAVGRLAAGVRESAPQPSRLMAGWLAEELGADSLGALAAHTGIGALLGSRLTCSEAPAFVGGDESYLPLHVTSASGESQRNTVPQAATDGNTSPALGKGWIVRSRGGLSAVDLSVPAGARVGEIHVVMGGDGSRAEARVLAQGADERWMVVAAQAASGTCAGDHVYRLEPPVSLRALRIELVPREPGEAVTLHEVWAVGSRS
jgi:spermidine synthase